MIDKTNYEKSEDEEVEEMIRLVTAAVENRTEDDKAFEFECPVCKGQARAILYMYNGSLHGAVECKNCGYIRI